MSEILYGVHPVREALASRSHRFREIWVSQTTRKAGLRDLVVRARGLGIKLRFRQRRQLDLKAGTTAHQGVVAFLSVYSYASLETVLAAAQEAGAALILVLDGIQDPQNLGALIRSAHVCGAHGVVVPKDRAAPLTAAVDKASAGALEHMAVARVTNLRQSLELFKSRGIWVVGLTMEARLPLHELDLCRPSALVIGGEAHGVRPLVKRNCDFLAAIPQRGQIDCLNAAAAGAMALYEAMRQRLTAGLKW